MSGENTDSRSVIEGREPPALVLFHGFTGTGQAWQEVIGALPASTDVWAPDLPGHGENSSVRPASFGATVAFLGRSIEARFDRPVRLAGYSMGGRLALGLASERPDLIAELILISCHAGLAETEVREDRAARDDALAADLPDRHDGRGLEAFVDRWQALPLFASQASLASAVLERQRQRRLAQEPEGLAWALRILSPGRMPDYGPRLSHLVPPVRLVAGALDSKYVAAMGRMAEALGGSAPTVLPGCGHNPVLEAPATLAEILSSHGSAVGARGGGTTA